ncbi:MAG: cation:dicarboxylase symporter family transporter [Bacteroidales bacterium]|nr:cation:dicarboxylase symporter family transporter [Bacteroidales bacterium]
MLKKLPLWAKIFIGMGLGILFGLISVWVEWETFTTNWVKPWGTIFLKLLKLIAVPLIFVSLVKGISSLTDITKLSRIGYKTIVIYLITTVFATTVGLAMVNIFKPGDVFPDEKQEQYREQFGGQVEIRQESAREFEKQSPLFFFEDMIPENFFRAAGDNSKMLQIIFFAILFSIALVLVPGDKTQVVKDFFDGLNEVILKIVDLIMRFAPIGVFALMAALVVDFSGDADIFTALGMYMLTVIFGLFILILGLYPLMMRLFAGYRITTFMKAILPAQLVAFTTSSSAATLPVTMKQVINELGVSKPIANFVLPVGVTINMDGTSCYQAIAAVFIAQVFGIDLTLIQQLTIVLTATLASIGSPGIPSGSIVMLIIVLNSVGLPVEGLALILGVDRPLDMLRTVVNITGDSTVSSIVARSEGELDQKS